MSDWRITNWRRVQFLAGRANLIFQASLEHADAIRVGRSSTLQSTNASFHIKSRIAQFLGASMNTFPNPSD
jgi:hypothetical protein